MMGYGDYGYGMMSNGWGWIMMIFILIIVVLGVLVLFRYLQHSGSATQNNSSSKAIDLLNERYARGELSDEEYKRKKSEILKG